MSLVPHMLIESIDADITFEVTMKSALYRHQSSALLGSRSSCVLPGLVFAQAISWLHLLEMLATSVEHAAMMLHVGRGKESRLGKTQK